MSNLSQFFGQDGSKLVPIEVFAVGGGGGGAAGAGGGGGGAGQVVYVKRYGIVGYPYPITVGAGGAAGTVSPNPSARPGKTGSASELRGIVTAGGGGGGNNSEAESFLLGSLGGGGSLGAKPFFNYLLSEDTVLAQNGYPSPYPSPSPSGFGAGPLSLYSPGTAGLPAFLIGLSSTIFGGGGGGGGGAGGQIGDPGGPGGGGTGGTSAVAPQPGVPLGSPSTSGTAGTANTGGGGGGGGAGATPGGFPASPGGAGGSGVVIIRYPTAFAAATVTGNTPTPAQPGYYVYLWNSGPGSITFN